MKLSHFSAAIGVIVALFFISSGIAAWGQQSSSQRDTSYSQVTPILQKYCMNCHTGAKPAKGLRLDSYENVMKGTSKEKIVIPGEPSKSSLLLRVTGDEKPRMPRNGPPWVSEQETVAIERWIAEGAKP